MLGRPPHKYCFLIGQTLVMSSLYEIHIGDVITLCFLVLKCLHQFSCSSCQKKGSPSMIFKNNEKIPGNLLLKKPGKVLEISWNFVSPKKWEPCYIYHPQTKFTKVMFSQVFVCPHGGRGFCIQGGWADTPPPNRILRDTVNERAVRMLLECILVLKN